MGDAAAEEGSIGRITLTTLAMLVGLGGASQAWGWGDVGHRIVCEIAFHELNEKARAEVGRLIRKDSEYAFFADACAWADHPKQREIEHFINVPRDFAAFTADRCPGGVKCLFSAIHADLGVLRTPGTSDQAKLRALKFLGHWLGDLHQPLHVSFADDRGGTKIVDRGPCATDLHGVWDWCIIEQTLGQNSRRIARHLYQTITAADRVAWQAGQIHDWATESLMLAREASVHYCVQKGSACDYDVGRPTYQRGSRERVVELDARYLNAQKVIVVERLKRGGVRLAHVLNQTLGQ